MLFMLLYSHLKKELKILKEQSFETISRLSDDDWDFFEYDNKDCLNEFLQKNPVIDISCVDVTIDGGVGIAENIRRNNSKGFIVLISDETTSPITYIKPTILAGSLLLRPLSVKSINQVFSDAVSEYLKNFRQRENNGECFVIDNRDGKQLVPYNHIICFESRAKKIFVCTENEEYSFYDTLDNLEKLLDGNFIRCHRSFIVSRASIKKILFSQNLIELINGSFVPLSRTYKSVFKELK